MRLLLLAVSAISWRPLLAMDTHIKGGTRDAPYRNVGGQDATYKSFGGDGAYRVAGDVHLFRPPTLAPVGLSPSQSPVPSTSSVLIPFQLEYGFDDDDDDEIIGRVRKLQDSNRRPTQEEFEGLLVQTERFYADLLGEAFESLISLEAVQVGDEYRPNNSLPVLVEIEIIAVFAVATDGTTPPTPEDVSTAMTNADYDGKRARCNPI